MTAQIHTGGCLCGAVRFEVTGPAKWTAWCHCASCRKHTGAPAAAFAGFERDQVHLTGQSLTRFASSPGVQRGFCSRCGSTISYEGDRWPSEFHVHVGAFDDPEAFPPKGDAFADERLSWMATESRQN
jgi:hypothetical protein